MNLLQHTIESLEGEEPPRVDRSKNLDHRGEVHGEMVVDGKGDSEKEETLTVLSEVSLAGIRLGHGDCLRREHTDGDT